MIFKLKPRLRVSLNVNEEDIVLDCFGQGAIIELVLLRNDQTDRIISTSKLHGSPHFHTWPINVVVFHDPQRSLVLRLVSRLDAFSGYLFHT